ncbi:hypothetical protein Ljor_0962 [Legionella jordanis]|uniref:Uncharacterized protein n=2 Tax=Legionella jordanis TaxID=456 RepID=A0A0W0V981_9GAMM|nr:hypothetical protein Ljor_0962 [Legionella jordanis]VEH11876.1 Protein of uncharacterised function (DUF2803) [Legionella jordanis]
MISCLVQGKGNSLYQIDLIVFTHQNASSVSDNLQGGLPSSLHAMPLRKEGKGAYRLLPVSNSKLRAEYWALNRSPKYHVLLHYSWLQPANNQQAVLIPKQNRDGWQVEGTIRVRRSNYYLLDSNLFFSTADGKGAFLLAQKQRLKGGDVYYLDHPQAGILIKVHQIA